MDFKEIMMRVYYAGSTGEVVCTDLVDVKQGLRIDMSKEGYPWDSADLPIVRYKDVFGETYVAGSTPFERLLVYRTVLKETL